MIRVIYFEPYML